jgi:hypothetical protein
MRYKAMYTRACFIVWHRWSVKSRDSRPNYLYLRRFYINKDGFQENEGEKIPPLNYQLFLTPSNPGHGTIASHVYV